LLGLLLLEREAVAAGEGWEAVAAGEDWEAGAAVAVNGEGRKGLRDGMGSREAGCCCWMLLEVAGESWEAVAAGEDWEAGAAVAVSGEGREGLRDGLGSREAGCCCWGCCCWRGRLLLLLLLERAGRKGIKRAGRQGLLSGESGRQTREAVAAGEGWEKGHKEGWEAGAAVRRVWEADEGGCCCWRGLGERAYRELGGWGCC
jgi:hypothetical protein